MVKKNLKILLTTWHSRLHSGSTHQLYLLAKELKKRGHQVYALFKGVAKDGPHPSLQPLLELGVKVDLFQLTKLKYKHTVPELIRLRGFLWREQFDVINTFGGTDLTNIITASFGMFIPVLIAYRGLAEPLDFFNSLKYRLPKVRKVIANSQAVKRIMMETGRIPEEKIVVIYGGFELEKFQPERDGAFIRKEFHIPDSAPVVILIGHLKFDPEHRKGGYYFLQACERVLQEKPETRFLLVGKVDRENFEKLASPALRDASILTGYRTDIPELISASDLLVNASLSEGLAGVIREGMAMAKPVVATEIDGSPELVKHNETGLLVPPRNPEALARAILKLLNDQSRAKAMGAEGRRLVERLCNNETRADKYEQLYFEEYEKATQVKHRFLHWKYWGA